ncbi:hypothetical protein QFC21_004811 [Naganishia friedmannii]|uniref:Uncharacterized protein n=1 Tax=Naganishia friedmannii TaxID=89922 RepID=A0ACC2VF02_9TREE|nr:hypothetical protein QFC21_004811 [Naganishia friedmannii]
MPPNQQIVKDWLARVLVPYPSSGDLTREVLDALAQYPTLQVKTDAYTYDSGQTHLLLQLHGTIPISYRSAIYHIPLGIFFPVEYPRRAPMVYVQPTREMAVRRSDEVEPGGRVVGGLVGEWGRKGEAPLQRASQPTSAFEIRGRRATDGRG